MVKLSEVKARCTICGDTLKIVNKGTTTLANHLIFERATLNHLGEMSPSRHYHTSR